MTWRRDKCLHLSTPCLLSLCIQNITPPFSFKITGPLKTRHQTILPTTFFFFFFAAFYGIAEYFLSSMLSVLLISTLLWMIYLSFYPWIYQSLYLINIYVSLTSSTHSHEHTLELIFTNNATTENINNSLHATSHTPRWHQPSSHDSISNSLRLQFCLPSFLCVFSLLLSSWTSWSNTIITHLGKLFCLSPPVLLVRWTIVKAF